MAATGKTAQIRAGRVLRKIEYAVRRPAVPREMGYLWVKRCMDILLAALAGAVLWAPMLAIGLWVRLDSPGPALYRQERLGRDGRPFAMYKFRSMIADAERDGPQWARKNDPRCTRAGRFLRRTHLDELPQLWNILIGDMSFVGPRPERAYFYDRFSANVDGFHRRLAVRPGLTGLAQINGGYNLSPEEKLAYDMEYIQNQSLLLDLKCILLTIRLVLAGEGAR